MLKTQRLNFSWRCQPCKGSETFLLIKYLTKHSRDDRSGLILKALKAYYYPYCIPKSDLEKKEIALKSILDLIDQINQISLHCGISESQVKQLFWSYFGGADFSWQPQQPQPTPQQQPQQSQPTPQQEDDSFDPDLLSFENFMIKKEFK